MEYKYYKWLFQRKKKIYYLNKMEKKVCKYVFSRVMLNGHCLGSISAALSCLVYPPREERLDAWPANHVCDVNSQFNLCGAPGRRKCYRITTYGSEHLYIWICRSIFFFKFPLQPILFYIIAAEESCMHECCILFERSFFLVELRRSTVV